MRRGLIIPFFFLSSVVLTGLMPVEKEFESNLHALTLYGESIGADATSTEHYLYWADGDKIKKCRFMVVEQVDNVRTLVDMYFDGEGKLVLYTYWSGKRKDVKLLEKGSGPHFLAEGKCVFRNGKMVEWFENEKLRKKIPMAEWNEQEKFILHFADGAIDGWREVLQRKEIGSVKKR